MHHVAVIPFSSPCIKPYSADPKGRAAVVEQRPQYLVTTSEFNDVQERLRSQLNRRKADPKPNVPTLRRPGERPGPIEDQNQRDQGDDERPTLKRNPAV